MAKTEAKGTRKGFKLTKRWIAAISVVAGIALIVVTALITTAATKNPGVKVFDTYISAAKSQNVKKMAETIYVKNSDEYKDFVEKYEAGKSQYSSFLSQNPSETEKNLFLSAGENLNNPDDRKDYGLRLEWEKNFAKNIKDYRAYVVYSDSYLIRINVKIDYRESYSSTNLPGKLGAKEVPFDLELRFKRIGNKWYFDAAFRFLTGQSDARTWFAPYGSGGTEVKRIDPYDISTEGTFDLTNINGITDITSIGAGAFKDCLRLKTLIIPDGLVNIGAEAFRDCKNLQTIKYKSEIKDEIIYVTSDKKITVGDAAFFNCENLTRFDLSDEIKIIPNYVFYNCAKLDGAGKLEENKVIRKNEYPLSEAVTAIGHYAFYGCVQLTDIPLPAKVTSIGDGAFENCTALICVEADRLNKQDQGITIENALNEKITRMGANAFKNSGLRVVKLQDSILDIPLGIFNGCSSLAEVSLPSTLRSIGAYAFAKTGLKGISLPASLEKIGNYAFANSSIGYVKWEKNSQDGTSIRTIGEYSFNSCASLISLDLPETIRGIGKSAFTNCTALRSVMVDFPATVVIPSTGTDNGEIFAMSSGIPKIYVKEGLESFKRNWFSMRLDLYSQDIIHGDFAIMDESRTDASNNIKNERILVQYLGTEESPTVPSDITRLGGGAFSYSKQLKGISNFASLNLTGIERHVFAGCENMIFDVYGDAKDGTLKYLSGWLVDGSDIADKLDLTDRNRYTRNILGVTTPLINTIGIAAAAFESTDIISVKFNQQLKYICESAFSRILNLKDVGFENVSELLRVGSDAFSNSALDHIEFTSTKLAEIDSRAFYGCDNLRYVIINSTVPVKLGGTAQIDKDGKAAYAQGEDMFFVGYDVLKLYVNNYNSMKQAEQSTTSYYKENTNWQAYKDILFDKSIINSSNNYSMMQTEREIKDKDGKVLNTVTEMTLIQLLSTSDLPVDPIANVPVFNIPDTVERIGAGAFAKSTLEKVVIHSNLKRIEQYAFYECKQLFSVTFEARTSGSSKVDSLIYVGTHAFRDTDELSGSKGIIEFKADAPNSILEFGVEPFDSAIYRKVVVEVRENYENYREDSYWKANRDMLKAGDDPWITVGLELVVINNTVVQDITGDIENHKNTVTPNPDTIYKAPGDSQELEAKDDTDNGYRFVGWYDENGQFISGDMIVKPEFGAKNTGKTYIARFERERAWVNILIDEIVRGGDIYNNNKKVSIDDLSNDYYRGGILVDCFSDFTMEARPHQEYAFVGWFIGEDCISNNAILEDYSIEYQDLYIEARFIKVKEWVELTQQPNGTVTIVGVYNAAGTDITASTITDNDGGKIRVLLRPDDYVVFGATPNSNNYYEIDSWFENGVRLNKNAATHTVTMTTVSGTPVKIPVRVEFTKIKVLVDIAFNPDASGIVYIDNAKYENAETVEIPQGSEIMLVADGKPGYKFVEWRITVGSNQPETKTSKSIKIKIENLDPISVVAVFETAADKPVTVTYESGFGNVTIKVNQNEVKNVVSAVADPIPYNSEITLKAQPLAGYWFAGWYDVKTATPVLISDKTELKLKVNDEITTTQYEARFKLIEDAVLTINFNKSNWVDGKDWGEAEYYWQGVTKKTYSEPVSTKTGTVITLTAQYTKESHIFEGWFINGQLVSAEETYAYLVNNAGAQAIEARFQKKVLLTIKYEMSMGDVDGSGDYITGNDVTLTATPKENYRFVGWYLDNREVSTNSSFTVTLTDSAEYEARFVKA